MEASIPHMLGKHTVLHSPALQYKWLLAFIKLEQKLHICSLSGMCTDCLLQTETFNGHAAAQIPTEITFINFFLPSQCLISRQRKWRHNLSNN